MAHSEKKYDDDDDFDVPSIRKESSHRTLLTVLAIVGGLMLIVCLLAGGIAAVIAIFGDSNAAKLHGSWKGRFVIGALVIDSTYTFKIDGSFREEAFNAFGQRMNVSDGKWRLRNNLIEIDWDTGTRERASVTFVDQNTMTYRIVDHTQAIQIGIITTFRRQ